jgi:hypothetical protein
MSTKQQPKPSRRLIYYLALMVTWVGSVGEARAQTFSSGSTGADGALNINSVGVTNFTQTPQGGGTIFNFTTINIGLGATLKISGENYSGPMYFLAQGPVTISGTLDISGANGDPFPAAGQGPTPPIPGPGGYFGGVGAFGSSAAQPGSGPGGGLVGGPNNCMPNLGFGGVFSGNPFLVPLVGGSGGGGYGLVTSRGSNNGGAGGGAILIASSASITVTGTITAAGGASNAIGFGVETGGGSGGAIRLVAPSVLGTGTLTAAGGNALAVDCGGASTLGGAGIVRIEAFQNTFSGMVAGQEYIGAPYNLLLPTAAPTVQITRIGGVQVSPSPTGSLSVPDVTVNSNSPLAVQIQAQNIPVGATVKLYLYPQTGSPQIVTSSGLTGSLASSTATASVTLQPGFTLSYVSATWTQ